MTREEAKDFLTKISYALGNMSVEYLSEKDGERMREAIEALEQEPILDKIRDEIERKANSGQWSEAVVYGMKKSIVIIDKYKAESEDNKK